jgi:CheY-like chemotaxis protein
MSRRILVADDDSKIRLLYREQLSRAGYDVECVASGQEAIDKCVSGAYDVVILDIEMPGMSGIEALVRLRQLAPDIRVILNSAFSIYKSDFHTWLADAYVVKSSELDTLIGKIEEVVATV